jgi:hypothetical protein
MLIRALFYFILAVAALFTVAIISFFVGYYIFLRKKIKRLRSIRKIRYEKESK